MIAKDIIARHIPEITLSEQADNVFNLMEEHRLEHLPVIESGRFMGLISLEEVAERQSQLSDMLLGNFELIDCTVSPDDHIFEVLRVASQNSLSLVPVVDNRHQYLGSITIGGLLEDLTTTLGMENPGGIIVLEVNARDYSLQEIATVVEGNDAKVLFMQVTHMHSNDHLYITLKVNKPDINGILQTFNRYGYTVRASFQEDSYTDDMRLRYEELMRYINL